MSERKRLHLGVRTSALINGEVNDLHEWDLEELKRGRRRDKNGGFRGRDPLVIPRIVNDEYRRRLYDAVHTEIRDGLLPAAKQLRAISEGTADAKPDQLRAIHMVLGRGLGKVADAVAPAAPAEQQEPAPWEHAITAGIVALPDTSGVIDATSRAVPADDSQGWWLDDEDQKRKPTKSKPRKPRKAKP